MWIGDELSDSKYNQVFSQRKDDTIVYLPVLKFVEIKSNLNEMKVDILRSRGIILTSPRAARIISEIIEMILVLESDDFFKRKFQLNML